MKNRKRQGFWCEEVVIEILRRNSEQGNNVRKQMEEPIN